jgi:hypothetical protein
MRYRQLVPFASAARTASPTEVEVAVLDTAEVIEVFITATAIAATPSVVFNVQFPDAAGNWVTALASAAVTAVSTTRLLLGKGVVAAANTGLPAVLPDRVRIQPVHGDADSITYSVAIRAR